jgi:hypothetical protein
MHNSTLIYPIALAAAAVADVVFSATWMHWYFRFGVALFVKEIRLEGGNRRMMNAEMLQSHFDTVFRGQRMKFRELAPNAIGVRERLFSFGFSGFRYTPLMHGLLTFDEREGIVKLRGVVNLTFLMLTAIVLFVVGEVALPHSPLSLVAILIYLPVPLAIYLIQRSRYVRILKVASGK